MRYLMSRLKSDTEERIYRIYVTDSLYYQGRNMTTSKRYVDIINEKPQENRSAEEIVDDVVKKFGFKLI